jgi:diaminobutyrate-2-oxoglutarate transaminase
MPFDGYMGDGVDTAAYLDKVLVDNSSGVDMPAAIIVETVQSEGGINVASADWLRRIAEVAKKHDVLFIIDDIQTGCGRTGKFFSFEEAGIKPDMVLLSKALGGMGLPMSLVLFRPDLDVLSPGQHNGTFRGHNLAFVGATAALDLWRDPTFENVVQANARTIRARLDKIVEKFPGHGAHIRGRGMMVGISWDDASIASKVSKAAFDRKLIIETCGAEGQVLKLLPPLTITEAELAKGLDALEAAVADIVGQSGISDAA